MPSRDEHASEHWTGEPQRRWAAPHSLSALLPAPSESDCLSLWIPVLFGSGILAYFAL